MSHYDTQPGDLPKMSKIIDVKLPLPWLLSVAGVVAGAFVSTYFQVGRLRDEMVDLKATVQAGTASSSTIHSEIAVLRYRVGNLETAAGRTPYQHESEAKK